MGCRPWHLKRADSDTHNRSSAAGFQAMSLRVRHFPSSSRRHLDPCPPNTRCLALRSLPLALGFTKLLLVRGPPAVLDNFAMDRISDGPDLLPEFPQNIAQYPNERRMTASSSSSSSSSSASSPSSSSSSSYVTVCSVLDLFEDTSQMPHVADGIVMPAWDESIWGPGANCFDAARKKKQD